MKSAICALLSALFMLGCNVSENPEIHSVDYSGPFYAAFSVVVIQGVEFQQVVGPYIDKAECNQFVIDDADVVFKSGGSVRHSICVESDIDGIPLEQVEFDRSQRDI